MAMKYQTMKPKKGTAFKAIRPAFWLLVSKSTSPHCRMNDETRELTAD
jgi:hypothetical protein